MTDEEIKKLAEKEFPFGNSKWGEDTDNPHDLDKRKGFLAGYKAAMEASGIKDNKIALLEEDLLCVHKYLDDINMPRVDSEGEAYSIVGRIRSLEETYLRQMSQLETNYLAALEASVGGGLVGKVGKWTDVDIRESYRQGFSDCNTGLDCEASKYVISLKSKPIK